MNIILRTLIIISTVIILYSCGNREVKTDNNPVVESPQSPTEENSDSLILTLTKQVLATIKKKNYKILAEYIHPTLGLRFSPYAHIDTTDDVRLTPDKFLYQVETHQKFNWGNYDGSGDTILLTIEDYFSKFVYNVDFLNAEKTSLNKIIGTGNSLNNLETVYKGCDFTECYFSGFDKKFEGMDWCCLRLVFKKHVDKFYLVGIVHDQWTI